MSQLNQVIAVLNGSIKPKAESELTAAYHLLQRGQLLTGLARTYQPNTEDGDVLPPEGHRVQVRAGEILAELSKTLTRLYDMQATMDWANTKAVADVKVGEQVVVKAAPVTYLLFLEKQLVKLHTFISKLPILDPGEAWTQDEVSNSWRSEPSQTVSRRREKRVLIKYEATDKHPAQTEPYEVDVPVGTWTMTKFSGAMPAGRVQVLIERVEELQRAVKVAREEANSIAVADQAVGKDIFDYILA